MMLYDVFFSKKKKKKKKKRTITNADVLSFDVQQSFVGM